MFNREREDFMSQLRSSRKMCDELDGDLKQVRREKNTILEERDKLNEENKSLSQTMNEQQVRCVIRRGASPNYIVHYLDRE